MKSQAFRQTYTIFYTVFETVGCILLTDLRGVNNSATPSATSFLLCNYVLDDNVSVTTVHLSTPSNPQFLHTPSLLPRSLSKLNLLTLS